MPPRIAVTPARKPEDYLTSMEQAGAAPRLVAIEAHPVAILDEVDGLLLTGGGDLDPRHYGEAPHPLHSAADPGRDELELELAIRAIERDVPILAICRGLQILNVALGGTLIQDIPSMVPQALEHQTAGDLTRDVHTIALTADTRLAQTLAGLTLPIRVNSRHHQAIKRLASPLVVSAVAPDGIIEAVEHPGARFCLAVQWHPENFWRTRMFAPLFDAFARAAQVSRVRT